MKSLIVNEIDQIGGGYYCISQDGKWAKEMPEVSPCAAFMDIHYPNTGDEFRLQVVITAMRTKCRKIFTGGRIKESLDDDYYL